MIITGRIIAIRTARVCTNTPMIISCLTPIAINSVSLLHIRMSFPFWRIIHDIIDRLQLTYLPTLQRIVDIIALI